MLTSASTLLHLWAETTRPTGRSSGPGWAGGGVSGRTPASAAGSPPWNQQTCGASPSSPGCAANTAEVAAWWSRSEVLLVFYSTALTTVHLQRQLQSSGFFVQDVMQNWSQLSWIWLYLQLKETESSFYFLLISHQPVTLSLLIRWFLFFIVLSIFFWKLRFSDDSTFYALFSFLHPFLVSLFFPELF